MRIHYLGCGTDCPFGGALFDGFRCGAVARWPAAGDAHGVAAGTYLGSCRGCRADARGLVLNAGDAYFYRRELDNDRPRCTPSLRLYQTMMEVDPEARLGNQDRLRPLKHEHGSEVTVFCSHDEIELEAMQRAAGQLPSSRDRR